MLIQNSLLLRTFKRLINGIFPRVHNPDILFLAIWSDWQERSMSHQFLSAADTLQFLFWTIVIVVFEAGIFYSHYYNFSHGNKTRLVNLIAYQMHQIILVSKGYIE
jgi:hypothetical protein